MDLKKPNFRSPLVEARYLREMRKMLRGYVNFSGVGDDVDKLLAKLEQWKRVDFIWSKTPELIAKRMVTMVTLHDNVGWRRAASQSSKGRLIYDLIRRETNGPLKTKLNELIEENSTLIRTVPYDTARTLTKLVYDKQMSGLRSDVIVRDVQIRAPKLLDWQAKRIARTEVSKATTAVTRVRSEEIGLNWYQWQSVDDARTRPAHRGMDNVLINWSDPPSPELLDGEKAQGHYHAGNIYNCRCEALPVTSLDEIHWPAKVYVAGKILSLTKRQFQLQFSQGLLAA